MQPSLFTADPVTLPDAMPPARRYARASDPATSHAAAEAIAPAVSALVQWAAECVRRTPGRTQRELGAIHCPDDLRRIGRRLCEAARKGLIRRGDPRKCSITGRQAETWFPVEG